MYKDKDRQREAVKLANRRYRAKNKVSAISGQKQGLINARGSIVRPEQRDTLVVIPSKRDTLVRPMNISDNQWTMMQIRAGVL